MSHPYRYEARDIKNSQDNPIIADDSESLHAALMNYHKEKQADDITADWATVFLVLQIAEDGFIQDSFGLEATADTVYSTWIDLSRYNKQ
jgi:hypothetical protein